MIKPHYHVQYNPSTLYQTTRSSNPSPAEPFSTHQPLNGSRFHSLPLRRKPFLCLSTRANLVPNTHHRGRAYHSTKGKMSRSIVTTTLRNTPTTQPNTTLLPNLRSQSPRRLYYGTESPVETVKQRVSSHAVSPPAPAPSTMNDRFPSTGCHSPDYNAGLSEGTDIGVCITVV